MGGWRFTEGDLHPIGEEALSAGDHLGFGGERGRGDFDPRGALISEGDFDFADLITFEDKDLVETGEGVDGGVGDGEGLVGFIDEDAGFGERAGFEEPLGIRDFGFDHEGAGGAIDGGADASHGSLGGVGGAGIEFDMLSDLDTSGVGFGDGETEFEGLAVDEAEDFVAGTNEGTFGDESFGDSVEELVGVGVKEGLGDTNGAIGQALQGDVEIGLSQAGGGGGGAGHEELILVIGFHDTGIGLGLFEIVVGDGLGGLEGEHAFETGAGEVEAKFGGDDGWEFCEIGFFGRDFGEAPFGEFGLNAFGGLFDGEFGIRFVEEEERFTGFDDAGEVMNDFGDATFDLGADRDFFVAKESSYGIDGSLNGLALHGFGGHEDLTGSVLGVGGWEVRNGG